MVKDRGSVHLIIGCSKLGAEIAKAYSKEGAYVSVIDKDPNAKYKLGDTFLGTFVCGDATNANVLKEVGISSAKEVVVVTDNDDVNVFVTNILYKIFEKNNVVIRLNDETKEKLLLNKNAKVINPFNEAMKVYRRHTDMER